MKYLILMIVNVAVLTGCAVDMKKNADTMQFSRPFKAQSLHFKSTVTKKTRLARSVAPI